MRWICSYGAQRQTSAKSSNDSQINGVIDGDMERHEITHILTFGIIYLSNFAIWMIIKWYFNVVLISIYLIAGEFEHLFVYLLPTRTSPSVNCLGISLAHFSIGFPCPFVLV